MFLPLGRIVNFRFVMQAVAANLGAVESGNANPKISLGKPSNAASKHVDAGLESRGVDYLSYSHARGSTSGFPIAF